MGVQFLRQCDFKPGHFPGIAHRDDRRAAARDALTADAEIQFK